MFHVCHIFSLLYENHETCEYKSHLSLITEEMIFVFKSNNVSAYKG